MIWYAVRQSPQLLLRHRVVASVTEWEEALSLQYVQDRDMNQHKTKVKLSLPQILCRGPGKASRILRVYIKRREMVMFKFRPLCTSYLLICDSAGGFRGTKNFISQQLKMERRPFCSMEYPRTN